MTRRIPLLLACSALLCAAPALALAQTGPDRVKARPGKPRGPVLTVDSWGPKTGKVGAAITIRGSGFTPRTEVLVGGRPVRPSRVKPTWLEFSVPSSYGDGAIILRHPGVARDISVGTFAVVEDLSVQQVSPAAGSPGTRVEIRGSGFHGDDRVIMNGRPIQVNTVAPRRIVATIPDWATTDYLTVTRADGTAARSPGQFAVRLPAPTIADVTPWTGMPGAQVRISGQYFTPGDDVLWGRRKIAAVARGQGWVDVRIPDNARGADYLYVRNGNGQARAPKKFALEQPPQVTRIAPEYGAPGTTVQVYGAGFGGGDQVTLAGGPVQVLQIRPRQITVRIPPGARSGRMAVTRGGYQVAAPRPFDVVYAPVLSDWGPKGGEYGTEVTLRGDYFTTDAVVYYGARKLPMVRREGDRALTVRIPDRAGNAILLIRTKGGQVATSAPFEVYSYPVVTGAGPLTGYAGTRVTLRGRDLDHAQAVYVGGTALAIVSRSPGTLVCEVPAAASDDWLYVESYGKRVKSKYRFDVLSAPQITDVNPWSGVPGAEVVVTGRDFTPRTKVYFGTYAIPIVRRSLPTQIVVKLPASGIAGKDFLYVEDGGQRYKSAKPFHVVRQMTVTKYWPEAGKPGMELTVDGEYFGPATKVYVGKGEIPVTRRGDNQLVVRLPDNLPPGKYPVRVRDDYTDVRLPRQLVVRPSSVLAKFLPAQVEPGGAIAIEGSHFTGQTRVYWGDLELRVLTRSRKGDKLTVVIPDDAPKDKRWLFVDEYGVRSRSATKLDVFLPPEKRPTRVRDYRDKQPPARKPKRRK